MTKSREAILKKTLDNIGKLPDQKLVEVSDFAEFLLSRLDDRIVTEGIQKLVEGSKSYDFLETDPIEYSVEDVKELYNEKR